MGIRDDETLWIMGLEGLLIPKCLNVSTLINSIWYGHFPGDWWHFPLTISEKSIILEYRKIKEGFKL